MPLIPAEPESLTDEELELLTFAPLPSFPVKGRHACIICTQDTPNSGPYCTVCQIRYGQSRDGLVR